MIGNAFHFIGDQITCARECGWKLFKGDESVASVPPVSFLLAGGVSITYMSTLLGIRQYLSVNIIKYFGYLFRQPLW